MDTDTEITINVHLEEGKVTRFKEVELGLYIFSSNNKSNSQKISAYSYSNLVSDNKTNFARRHVERAKYARMFRRDLRYPRYT